VKGGQTDNRTDGFVLVRIMQSLDLNSVPKWMDTARSGFEIHKIYLALESLEVLEMINILNTIDRYLFNE
jgi:hypothetical protein